MLYCLVQIYKQYFYMNQNCRLSSDHGLAAFTLIGLSLLIDGMA